MNSMHNFYVNLPPYTRRSRPKLIWFLNKVSNKLGIGYGIDLLPDHAKDMNNVEQRINYFHLLNNVIDRNIEGDVVELGSFTGQCAILFQRVIRQNNSDKRLHLYDNFETTFKLKDSESVLSILEQNFKCADLPLPVIHKGFFQETLPTQLPEKISFVHIDCGWGGDPIVHRDIILYCLSMVYPKMPKGAICALMDYSDRTIDVNKNGHNSNPGVKMACDEFLADKPERVISLYANQKAHGYFKKQ